MHSIKTNRFQNNEKGRMKTRGMGQMHSLRTDKFQTMRKAEWE